MSDLENLLIFKLPPNVQRIIETYGWDFDFVKDNPATYIARVLFSLEWAKDCKNITYRSQLPELMRLYPGKIVAISENKVLEAGNLPDLFAKYRQSRMPPVEFFYVPTGIETGDKMKFQPPADIIPEI